MFEKQPYFAVFGPLWFVKFVSNLQLYTRKFRWSSYLYCKIILNERDSISTTHKSYLETFELCKFQVVLIVPFKLLWTWSELLTELITLMELHWWIDFFSISTNYCPASLQGGRRFIIFFGKKKKCCLCRIAAMLVHILNYLF